MRKLLPEQNPLLDLYVPSKDFKRVINQLPEYVGDLPMEGETVEIEPLSEKGYKPEVLLDYFLQGATYANSKNKSVTLYIPEGAKSRIEKKIDEEFKEVKPFIKIKEYPIFIIDKTQEEPLKTSSEKKFNN